MNNIEEIKAYVKKILRRKIWNFLDREDVEGEIMLALAKNKFRNESSQKTYVYAIANKKINDHYRSQYRRISIEANLMIDKHFFDNENHTRDLIFAIRSTPDLERLIITMYYFCDMTDLEISELMRKSSKYIFQIRHRALNMLREKLIEMDFTNHNEIEKSKTSCLTEQEITIFESLGKGLNNDEIAHELHISSNTVRSHIKNIYKKLRCNDRVKIALFSNDFFKNQINKNKTMEALNG